MENALEEREEFQFPTTVRQAFEMYETVSKSLKALEGREKALKKYLADQIPIDRTSEDGHKFGLKEGVIHYQVLGESTSYKDALEDIVATLVPSNKSHVVDGIIKQHTKPKKPSDRFREATEEEAYINGSDG